MVNNKGLVEYARSKIGTNYVYGMKMSVMTLEKYYSLKKDYGSAVWDSDIKKVGTVCCDCSGLISAYTGKVRSSGNYKNSAFQTHLISTISSAPLGVLVWMSGHIGIYSGMKNGVPYYIAEDGSAYGCREVPLSYNKFTHWFECVDIEYVEEDIEMVDKTNILYNNNIVEVDRIFKDNTNYVKLRDLEKFGLKVGYDSDKNLPIVTN